MLNIQTGAIHGWDIVEVIWTLLYREKKKETNINHKINEWMIRWETIIMKKRRN
jgi:hypothetical protein